MSKNKWELVFKLKVLDWLAITGHVLNKNEVMIDKNKMTSDTGKLCRSDCNHIYLEIQSK